MPSLRSRARLPGFPGLVNIRHGIPWNLRFIRSTPYNVSKGMKRRKSRRGRKANKQRTSNTSANPVQYKPQPCREYEAHGSCPYQDKCRFVHKIQENSTQHKTQQLCREYQAHGSCPYQDKCRFVHEIQENSTQHKTQQLCREYQAHGFCPYQDKCRFVHETQENATQHKTQVCREYQAHGFCPYQDKCRFVHEIQENATQHKTQICREYQAHGFCPYQDKCRFVHEMQENAMQYKPQLCREYRAHGSCSYQDKCRLLHQGQENAADCGEALDLTYKRNWTPQPDHIPFDNSRCEQDTSDTLSPLPSPLPSPPPLVEMYPSSTSVSPPALQLMSPPTPPPPTSGAPLNSSNVPYNSMCSSIQTSGCATKMQWKYKEVGRCHICHSIMTVAVDTNVLLVGTRSGSNVRGLVGALVKCNCNNQGSIAAAAFMHMSDRTPQQLPNPRFQNMTAPYSEASYQPDYYYPSDPTSCRPTRSVHPQPPVFNPNVPPPTVTAMYPASDFRPPPQPVYNSMRAPPMYNHMPPPSTYMSPPRHNQMPPPSTYNQMPLPSTYNHMSPPPTYISPPPTYMSPPPTYMSPPSTYGHMSPSTDDPEPMYNTMPPPPTPWRMATAGHATM